MNLALYTKENGELHFNLITKYRVREFFDIVL
jgi:hypothetical protein